MELANFQPVNTFINAAALDGNQTIRVTKDPAITEVDEPTFARLVGSDFKNGHWFFATAGAVLWNFWSSLLNPKVRP